MSKMGFQPHATRICDLVAGDRVVFDPFFGVDAIMEIQSLESSRLPGFLYQQTLYVLKISRAYPVGDRQETSVVRNGSEPVVAWRMEEPPPSREQLAELRSEVDELLPATA
jgi:hypothetical protein